jgi:hypothetical protein
MVESTVVLVGKPLALLLLSIVSILAVWLVFGVLACAIACCLGRGTQGLCRAISRLRPHPHG